MTEKTWTWIDKAGWGEGPWQEEPDKIEWRDAATGYPCLIRRVAYHGALCGYVGVPPVHPWHGKDYDEIDAEIAIHGGLTYAAPCQEESDARGVCHVPEPGEPDHVWWFGFDAGHSGDLGPGFRAEYRCLMREMGAVYRSVSYMREEVARLAQQLAAVTR